MNLHITKDGTSDFKKAIALLLKCEVLVGIPASTAARDGDAPINNAALGYIHEYGSPARNIPARPFLHPGIANARQEIEKNMRAAGELALAGKGEQVEQKLNAVGLVAVAGVQEKITEGPFEPLKPATLAARRRRGRSGDRPLIDSGQLRRAINYIIQDKK